MSPAGQKQKPAASLFRASQNRLKDFLGDAWSAVFGKARVERHLAAVLALILLDTAG